MARANAIQIPPPVDRPAPRPGGSDHVPPAAPAQVAGGHAARDADTSAAIGAGEWRLLAAAIAGLLLITGVPYALAYATTPPDKVFMGIVLNVPDTAQYLAWAREFRHALLIENTLTPEPGEAIFINLFWLVTGRLAGRLGLGLAEATQIARVVAGTAYLGALYWLAALVARERVERWTSFLVLALGAGLGWCLVVAKQFTGTLAFPLDLYVMEPNALFTVMAFPHQAIAGGLLIAILVLAALAFERSSLRLAGMGGALALALGLQHGYDLLVVYAVSGCTAVLWALGGGNWKRAAVLLAFVCGPSVPAALYLAAITRLSPIWRGVLAQYGNAGVYTPPPPHLFVLLGLPLVLCVTYVGLQLRAALSVPGGAAWARARAALSRAPARELMLGAWLVVGFLLLYVPADFQIKLLAGWQAPVGIYATRLVLRVAAPRLGGIGLRLPWMNRWPTGAIIGAAFVLAVIPTNAYLVAWRVFDLARHSYPYYLHRDDLAALRWLESNAGRHDVVLGSLTIGQFVPSVSGTRPFLAHWAQTLRFFERRDMVARYYDAAASEAERRALLQQSGVRYVVHGAAERALGAYRPDQAAYLHRVFSSGQVSIYWVDPQGGRP